MGGASHFYRCYRCADDRYVAVGSIEPGFYAVLAAGLACAGAALEVGQAPEDWSVGADQLADIFAQRDRTFWCDLLEGTDACFAPGLSLGEAPDHPRPCGYVLKSIDLPLLPASDWPSVRVGTRAFCGPS